jgi:hypothetical protein
MVLILEEPFFFIIDSACHKGIAVVCRPSDERLVILEPLALENHAEDRQPVDAEPANAIIALIRAG